MLAAEGGAFLGAIYGDAPRSSRVSRHDVVAVLVGGVLEEFLDMVSATLDRPDGPEWRLIQQEALRRPHAYVVQGGLPTWTLALVRASCSFYATQETPIESLERWAPYIRWRDRLSGSLSNIGHTVITFNHDRVVERLGRPFRVVLPGEGTRDEHEVPVYKLHGSIDWWWNADRSRVLTERTDDHALPAICTPGPTKHLATSGPLKPLWDQAMAALRKANVVVFIGCRFPETDAVAKEHLLAAIGAGQRPLTVRIVLGPDVGSPDVARLAGMLRWAAARGEIITGDQIRRGERPQKDEGLVALDPVPMWSQDFLSVVDPYVLEMCGYAQRRRASVP